MFVHNILRKKGAYAATIAPDSPIIEALEVLEFENVGALVASRDGLTVLGVVSEKDIVRALHDHGRGVFALEVADLMSTPVISCKPTDTIAFVMSLMWRHSIHHVPALERGRLAGIVTYHDILDHRYGLSSGDDVASETAPTLLTAVAGPSVLRH